jgi:23S rRNA maturation mini-RNase III
MNTIRKSLKIPKSNQNPSFEGQTTQYPKEKGQATIYKVLHTKLKIEEHDLH